MVDLLNCEALVIWFFEVKKFCPRGGEKGKVMIGRWWSRSCKGSQKLPLAGQSGKGRQKQWGAGWLVGGLGELQWSWGSSTQYTKCQLEVVVASPP